MWGKRRAGLRRRVVAALLVAAAVGVAAEAPNALASCGEPVAPFGSTPCEGVRPGAVAIVPDALNPPWEEWCTLAFMIQVGGQRYMSTAGHCAADATGGRQWMEDGEIAWKRGEGAPVYDRDKRRIGEFAYAVFEGGEVAADFDFALIRLDPGVNASPEVCHFGGPTAINSDIVPITTPVMLHYYGTTWGGGHLPPLGSSEPADGQWLLPARTGLANGLPDTQRAYFYGHAFIGDSGAPVLSEDRRAVGIVSGLAEAESTEESTVHVGVQNATRLGPALDRAGRFLGRKLTLVTAHDTHAASSDLSATLDETDATVGELGASVE